MSVDVGGVKGAFLVFAMATPYGSVNNQAVVMNMKGAQNIGAFNTAGDQPFAPIGTGYSKSVVASLLRWVHGLIALASACAFFFASAYWVSELTLLQKTDDFPYKEGHMAWSSFFWGMVLLTTYNFVSIIMWIVCIFAAKSNFAQGWPERKSSGFLLKFLFDSISYGVVAYLANRAMVLHNVCPANDIYDDGESKEKCMHAMWYFYSQSRFSTSLKQDGSSGCETPYLSVEGDSKSAWYVTNVSTDSYAVIVWTIALILTLEAFVTIALLPCFAGGDVPFYILPFSCGRNGFTTYGLDTNPGTDPEYRKTSRFLSAFRMWYTVRKICWVFAFWWLWIGLSKGIDNTDNPIYWGQSTFFQDDKLVPYNYVLKNPDLVSKPNFYDACRMYPGTYWFDYNESSTGPLLMNYTGSSVVGWTQTKIKDDYNITLHFTDNKIPFSAASCAKGGTYQQMSNQVTTECNGMHCDEKMEIARRLEEVHTSEHVAVEDAKMHACGGDYDKFENNDQFAYMTSFWVLFLIGCVFNLFSETAYLLALVGYNVQPSPEANDYQDKSTTEKDTVTRNCFVDVLDSYFGYGFEVPVTKARM